MPDGHAALLDHRPAPQELLLDNGLQLVWEEDRRQPLIAIEARIRGGLRGEGPYLGAGMTHFIEHLLFKGTATRPPGTIDQEVRRYGGTINAFTSFDTTGVSLFVESRYLREALALLADILQHAVFDPAEVEKERAVVLSEIQMNHDDPDRRIHQLFWSRHLLEHPYRHPILGYQPLLERLTPQDLSAFYAAQYQPQHVTIACVGDLDGTAFAALATELFGAWPRGRIEQAVVPIEPPAASVKRAVVRLPVQTAYALLGFSSVRLADPDLYALDVLADIVGHGRSSRLYERLLRQRKLVHAISAWNYTPYDPGIFAVQFRTDPAQVDAATAAVVEILAEIGRRGVTEAELQKAKRAVSADYLFGLQTVEAKAADLASSLAATGDPLFSRRYVEGVEGVTAEAVQRAARRYCDAATMTVAVIQPAPLADAAPGAKPSAAPAAIPVTKLPLPNGATALIGVDRTLPIAALAVVFRGGVRVEEEATQGLCHLVSQLLTKGTKRKSAVQIAQQVESLGGSLEPFSGRDGFGLVLQLLAQDLEQGLPLLHELVTQSTFPPEELALQQGLIAKQLQAEDDEIFDVGSRLLRRTLFRQHPYRFSPLGSRETIDTLSRERCLEFAQRWLTPSNTVIAVFGDLDQDAVARQLQRTFGAMPSHASAWPAQLAEEPIGEIRQASRTLEKEQTLIMLGFLGSTHTAADRFAVDVLTAALSGMSGRLFKAVREAHGLSYALGAVHAPGWDPGYLLVYAATRPSEQATVLRLLEEQLGQAAEQGLTEEEIEQAKRYLIGAHRMDLQHLVGLAKRSAVEELFGLGYEAWKTYEADINAVTVPMVREAAQRYLTLDRRAEVVVSPNGDPH